MGPDKASNVQRSEAFEWKRWSNNVLMPMILRELPKRLVSKTANVSIKGWMHSRGWRHCRFRRLNIKLRDELLITYYLFVDVGDLARHSINNKMKRMMAGKEEVFWVPPLECGVRIQYA